jgi:hypothetical protein
VCDTFYAGVSVNSESQVQFTSYSPTDSRTFRRGRSPDVLVAAGAAATPLVENPSGLFTRIEFLLRRARGMPTELNTAGRYHMIVVQAGAKGTGNGIELGAEVLRGTCVLNADGSASVEATTGSAEAIGDLVGEQAFDFTDVRRRRPGYWEPVFGVVVFGLGQDPLDFAKPRTSPYRSDLETDFETQLTPVLDGSVLVGIFGDVFASQSDAGLIFLVREGSGLSPARIGGSSFGAQFEMRAISTGVDPNMFEFAAGTGSGNRTGTSFSLVGASAFSVFHDGNGGPSSQLDFTSVSPTESFSVSTKGVYLQPQSGLFGCVAPRGDFILSVVPGTTQVPFQFRMDLPAQ